MVQVLISPKIQYTNTVPEVITPEEWSSSSSDLNPLDLNPLDLNPLNLVFCRTNRISNIEHLKE